MLPSSRIDNEGDQWLPRDTHLFAEIVNRRRPRTDEASHMRGHAATVCCTKSKILSDAKMAVCKSNQACFLILAKAIVINHARARLQTSKGPWMESTSMFDAATARPGTTFINVPEALFFLGQQAETLHEVRLNAGRGSVRSLPEFILEERRKEPTVR